MPHSPLLLAGLVLLILAGLALWGLGLPGAGAGPEEVPDDATEEAAEEAAEGATAGAAQAVPVELGAVSWLRDFDAAVQIARERDQALLLLFQEVPG